MVNPFPKVKENVGNITKDFINKVTPSPSGSEIQKQRCIARGGTWDEANQVCIMPKPAETPKIDTQGIDKQTEAYKEKISKVPKTLRNEQGNLSGIEIGGKTYLGLSPDEVNTLSEQYQNKIKQPQGTISAGKLPNAEEYRQMQIEQQALASQVGQFGELGALSPTPLDYSQVIKQAGASVLPSALQGAGTLAVAGGILGGGAGTALAGPAGTVGGAIAGAKLGAALGAVGGITRSMLSTVKSQKMDNVNAQKRVLDEGKQQLAKLVQLMNAYPEKRTEILKTYNAQATQIRRAYEQIKLNTQYDLFEYENAIPDLAEFDAFFSYGGEFDNLNAEMELAIKTGSRNPDLMIQEIFKEYGYE